MEDIENIKKETTPKKFRLSPSITMLIIAAIALLVGIIAPPAIRDHENKCINEDCRTASEILDAVKNSTTNTNIAQQITQTGWSTITWTAVDKKGVITCTNNLTDLQNAVTNKVGDVPRKSKTLGTAVWTVTVTPSADGSGYTVNGAWTGAIGADDNELTTKSGGTVAQ